MMTTLKVYSEFKEMFLRTPFMADYSPERDRGDAFLDWVKDNPSLLDMWYETVYYCVNLKRHSRGLAPLFEAVGLAEGELEARAAHFTICTLYGYYKSAKLSAATCGVDKYEFLAESLSASRGLIIALECMGRKVNPEVGALRDFLVYIIHALTSRIILRKRDSKAQGGGVVLQLNVVTSRWPDYEAIGVSARPCSIKVLGGQPIIRSSHYFCLEAVIRQNKRGGGATLCKDPSHLIVLANTRFFVDEDCLKSAISLLKAGDGGLGVLDDSRSALAYMEAEASANASKLRYKGGDGGFYRKEPVAGEAASLYSLLLISENLERLSEGFYYRYYMDFRGRTYSDGPASYTHNRWVRFCLKMGDYSADEVAGCKLRGDKLSAWGLVSRGFPCADTAFKKEAVVSSLEQLGKLRKSGRSSMSYSELVEEGAKVYESGHIFADKLDELESRYYRRALEYAAANNNSGFIYYKDATASGLQVLSLFLGCRNDEVRRHLNISADGRWYDTYSYLIRLLESNGLIPEGLKSYFNRKALKKTFMLLNYGGTLYKCEKEFLGGLGEIGPQLRSSLAKAHAECYRFLAKAFDGDLLFQKPSTNLLSLLGSGSSGLGGELRRSGALTSGWLEQAKEATSAESCLKTWSFENTSFSRIKEGPSLKKTEEVIRLKGALLIIEGDLRGLKVAKSSADLRAAGVTKPVNTAVAAAERKYDYFKFEAAKSEVVEALRNRRAKILARLAELEAEAPEMLVVSFSQDVEVCYNYSEEDETRIEHKYSRGEASDADAFIAKFKGNYLVPCREGQHRHTLKVYNRKELTDVKATCSAFRANFTHSADAALARTAIVLVGSDVALIHDSAGVRLMESGRLVRAVQSAYSRVSITVGGRKLEFVNKVSSPFVWL